MTYDKDVILQVDVITSEIPCLISKTTMKKAGAKINLVDDEIELFGNKVKMHSTNSGHYTLPIKDLVDKTNIASEVFMAKTDNPVYIHKSLGHPSRQAMVNTLKAANVQIDNLDNILNKLYENCLNCLYFHKTHVLANDFNNTICLDLKIWPKKKVIIFYIINAFTRFSQAHIIPDKTPESKISRLMDNWILNMYGAPKNIMTDCGGEFYNNKFKDMCQNLNIKIYNTAAESPFQNGICERNHAVTDRIMEKMSDDPTLTVKKALSAATFAKNALAWIQSNTARDK